MPAIATNFAANTSLRYVNYNTSKQNVYLSQLASGSRVTRAQDDASSLAIGVRISSDATTLSQASSSAAIGQSVLNIADGGLSQIANILERMKSLVTQAQSGTQDTNSFANIDLEYQALLTEIDSVASSTRYNGNNLLDDTTDYGPTAGGVTLLLGTDAADTITISIADSTATGLAVNGTDVTDATNAAAAATAIDAAILTLAGTRAQLGADQSRLDFRKNVIDVAQENTAAAVSSLLDADVAQVQSAYTTVEVMTEAGIAALQKANAIPQQLLQLLKS